MIAGDFAVEPIVWSNARDRDACRRVREEVFVGEQKVPIEDESDDLDALSHHILARDLTGSPIATGRLVPPQADAPARIGRMAVLKAWRGKKVGEGLMYALLDRARELGYRRVEMHAQSHAISFYERFGFTTFGEEFHECAIAHMHMGRDLDPLAKVERKGPSPESLPRAVETREQAVAATLAVIAGARRELSIYTRSLDPDLLDSDEMLEAVKALAIAGRSARIRVLVQTPLTAAQDGHRLIALGQRLSSTIEFRTPVAEDLQYASAFVVNDGYGYFFRTLGTRFDGEAATRAPGRGGQLQEYFDGVWERAELCDDLRQLNL